MKKNIHWWIYGGGLIISTLFIGISFIDMCQNGKNVLCGIGASGIGAVFLSFAIEWQNETRKIKQNKAIFQATNTDISNNIHFLLLVVYRIIADFDKILNFNNLRFSNITFQELLNLYIDDLEIIENEAAPYLCSEETISKDLMNNMRKQSKVKKLLLSYNEEIDNYRKNFDEINKQFEITKPILLANGICNTQQAGKLHQVLKILSSQGCVAHSEALLEMGKSLKELRDCELLTVINEICFERVRFNNENGYLGISWVNNK